MLREVAASICVRRGHGLRDYAWNDGVVLQRFGVAGVKSEGGGVLFCV